MVDWKKILNKVAPLPDKSSDGRDAWPSRTAFIFACCGGTISMGNLLRYPSQLFNNHGLQWFVPYLMALFLIAIPALMLEIAIGQAYRSGSVIAFNTMNARFKGIGIGMVYIGFTCSTYFAPILAWIMKFFQDSFKSPLPWMELGPDYFMEVIVANPAPIPGNFTESGAIESYTVYPDAGLIPHVTGWTVFIWFLVWICMCRGAGVTGRAAYVTVGLPVVATIVLVGRGASLENAGRGIKLYFATWRGETLAQPKIWQAACGQVFFSTGVAFGYYTAYASYNSQFSNAVQDSVIVACSNAAFEAFAAFGIFGIIGYLGLDPNEGTTLGSYIIGFMTYPVAVLSMPGSNFWAILFFLILVLLGVSSTFAMLDATVTMILDAKPTWSRFWTATACVLVAFGCSLIYCTRLGYYLMDGIDRYLNSVSLIFIAWSECVASTSLYRYRDVIDQVGLPSFALYNFAYLGGTIVGLTVSHTVSVQIGAGVGFGIFIAFAIASVLAAKTPDIAAPRFWGKNDFLCKFWYVAFYQGNQLRRDLNVTIAVGKNWALPYLWGPILRYVSAPVLSIVFSFAIPEFITMRNDPAYIFGFVVSVFTMFAVVLGFSLPRWLDVLVPEARKGESISQKFNVPQSIVEYVSEKKIKDMEEDINVKEENVENVQVLDANDEKNLKR